MTKAPKLSLDQAWKNWGDCLKGDDRNSIFRQIISMGWDTAIFKIIVQGRKSQIKKNPLDPELNSALHSFMDRNYFISQSTCIRRLIDDSYELTGKRGVYSISALLKDMCKYRTELTREKYLELRNMPYDYSEIQVKRTEFFRNQLLGEAFFVPSEYDWESIEEAHQIYDRLSCTTKTNRRPDDLIAEEVFIILRSKLDNACRNIAKYVDKYIAHSATPESRSPYNEASSKITNKHLWEAHQLIFEVAEFISLILFSEGHMALPLENPSFFDCWNKPLFENEEIDLVRTAFEDYRKETEMWNMNGAEKIFKWIEE